MVRANKKQQAAFQLDVPVKFGKVSFGDSTCNVSISISRDVMTLIKADEYFSYRRLSGLVLACPPDESINQTNFADKRHEVAGTFDVKGFRVGAKNLSTGVTFSLKDVDVGEFAKLANQTGRLGVLQVQDLDEAEESEAGDDDDEGNGLFPDEDADAKGKKKKRGREAAVAD